MSRVQILDKAVYILYGANRIGKGMYSALFLASIGKKWGIVFFFFNHDKVTGLAD